MRIQCENFIAFYVSIFDLQNPVVGPKVIYVDFLKYNNAPLFRSTFKAVSVAEDKAVDFVVATLDVIDNDIYPNLTLSMITDPPKGLDLYKLAGKQIQVRKALDYEYKDLREVKVSLKAFDGFCFSFYTLNITITNVNEPLVLRPLLLQPTYFEGFLCPTPPPTTTQAGQTTTIPASGSGTGSGVGFGINTTASNDVTFASRNVAWLSVAGVAFATFVTLLPFLVWRHACGSGKGPCGKGKPTTEYETLRTRTGANASDKIQKSPGNSTMKSLKQQQPRQNNQPSKQPQKSLNKAETNTKQPRSEILAIAAISTEPLMVPPHLPYPEYFVQSAPADFFTQKSDLVKQKGANTNHTSKAKEQKTSSKGDNKADGQNIQATPRRPKMDIGEEFDLQILTPR